jgi:N utilization substance protein B
MTARSKARKRALDIIFESEQRRVDPISTLAEREADSETGLNPYTAVLVRGVTAEMATLDVILADAAPGWPVDRMPAVDRTVLRIGAWELLHGDVPPGVAIDEAVELCKQLSTDDSPAFVNGVLARVLAERTGPDPGSGATG